MMLKSLTIISFFIICTQLYSQVLGPFVGGVTQNSAVFIVKGGINDYVSIELSGTEDFDSSLFTNTETPAPGNYGYHKFTVTNLIPYQKYFYRAVINSKPQEKSHTFRTFPANGNVNFSFGFGSCMQSSFQPFNKEIFRTIGNDTLSFFIQIGDWSYPDFAISRSYNRDWDLLTQTYNVRYDNDYDFVKYVLSSMPIAYVYDDHDYAGNNTDGSDPHKYNSIKAYSRYFPHYPLQNPDNGIWHSFTYGDVEFFMLDLRTQRSKNGSAFRNGEFDPPPGHSILAGYKINGIDQKEWFIRALKNSKAKWKVIVSTVLWNPAFSLAMRFPFRIAALEEHLGSLSDKWAGFPEDQKLVLRTIQENNIRNVFVLSGDSHSSYIDDGKNSIIPEIGASNLDVANSNMAAQIEGFGFSVFNKGSYGGDARCYGRVSFLYGRDSYAVLELVDEKGKVWASHRLRAD